MAEGIEFKLAGVDELNKIFKNLGPRIERNALRAGIRAGARVIVNDARSRIHNSPHGVTGNKAILTRNHPPGNLKKSIGVKAVRSKRTGIWLKVQPLSGPKAKHDGWYAHMVERETKNDPKARPFLEPAFNAKREEVITAVFKKLGQYLEKIQNKRL